MKKESWGRNHGRGIMEEESWRRHRGGGVMEGESWKVHHGGVIIEEAAGRRQPGRGNQEKAARRHQETPRRHQEAPRMPPGGTRRHPRGNQEAPRSVSMYVSVSVPILLLLLSVLGGRGTCGQQSRDCKIRGDPKCIGWQYVISNDKQCSCYKVFFCLRRFLRASVTLYASHKDKCSAAATGNPADDLRP